VASGLSITTPSVIEGARVWSSTTSVSPHDMSHVAFNGEVWLSTNDSTSSHSGQLLSRAVTFQFALDPNLEQRVLLAKCAGARATP